MHISEHAANGNICWFLHNWEQPLKTWEILTICIGGFVPIIEWLALLILTNRKQAKNLP